MDKTFISKLSANQKLTFLLSHYFTFLLILATILIVCSSFLNLTTKVVSILLIIYLLPPLLARLTLFLYPIKKSKVAMTSREFTIWWFLFSLQTIYARFTFLEEILRCIPGAYSFWLRVWGSKVGKMTYWAAGTSILDRSFLDIGDNVMFGAGVRINPHVIIEDKETDSKILLLDKVTIGNNVLIGGYALLTSGTIISDNECTKAFLTSPPFSTWKGGKITRDKK